MGTFTQAGEPIPPEVPYSEQEIEKLMDRDRHRLDEALLEAEHRLNSYKFVSVISMMVAFYLAVFIFVKGMGAK